MSRGLTAEKARERRERGLCPRHDIPAQPGGVLCARCLGKVDYARLYRVSSETLAAMARAVGAAALALWLVACPVGAASPPVRDLRVSAQAPAVTAAATISWTQPTLNARGIPLDPYRPLAWRLSFTTQAMSCRDSGLAWCRDTANFHVWIPQAGTFIVLASGYAQPGAHVALPAPPVSSLQAPWTWWIETSQQGGAWSQLSNPITRDNN